MSDTQRRRRAVFLDRDGTLNREQGYITTPEDLVLLRGAADAVRALDRAGWIPVVVTSQGGIAKGLYDETRLARIHERLQAACGGRIRAILHCPHHPDAQGPFGGPCPCRKPSPEMLLRARDLLDLDLEQSALVGDATRDLRMADGLGLTTILVRTGKPWRDQLEALQTCGSPPAHVADDLAAASEWLLAHRP